MVWCSHCVEYSEVAKVPDMDCVFCTSCGKLFEWSTGYGSDGLIGCTKLGRYIFNEKDKRSRKIIWEEKHKEYLEVQAAKKAAVAAAAKGACQDRLPNGSEELLSAQELETLTVASLAKSIKEKKRKHPPSSKSSTFAKSRGGTCHELKQKDDTKKQRTKSETGECENDEIKAIEETHKESEESAVNNAKDY